MSVNHATYLMEMSELIDLNFNSEEIRILCIEMGVDYENVAGDESSEQIRKLLRVSTENGRFPTLITQLQQVHPSVKWPPIPDDFQLPDSLLVEETAVPTNQHHIYGDEVQGDKIGGDKIIGDKITYGDVAGSYNAIGEGAQVLVNNIQNAIKTVSHLEKEEQRAEEKLAASIKVLIERYKTSLKEGQGENMATNPYKALLEYRLKDAPYFYGREFAINKLLDKTNVSPLTILYSASGSGKTSLMKAGLSSRLLADGHLPLYIRPFKQSPQSSIKKAFLPDIDTLDEYKRFRDMSLKGFLERVVHYLGEQRLYIFLDQFEELFTMQRQENRDEFSKALQDCIDANLPIRWTLALRKEYFADLRIFESVNPFDNSYFLATFKLEEAEEVISEPARSRDVVYEEGLIQQIVEDLKQEDGLVAPAQVQLVCHTLFEELQDEVKRDMITTSLYNKKRGRPGSEGQPGAKGILTSHLTRVLDSELKGKERRVATRLLEELVTSDTRRLVVEEADLYNKLDDFDEEMVNNVLGILDKKRLIRKEKNEDQLPVYELAHDYLLEEIQLDPQTLQRKAAQELLASEVRAYQQLATLLSEEKYNIINSQRDSLKLNETAEEMLDKSYEKIEASKNEELRKAQELAEEQAKRAEEAEARQIAESERAEEAEARQIAEAGRAKEAEARQIAEAERADDNEKSNKKLRRRAYVLGSVLVVAFLLAIFAMYKGYQATVSEEKAIESARIAQENEVKAQTQEAIAIAEKQTANEAEAEAEVAKENAIINLIEAENQKEQAEAARATAEANQKEAELQRDRALTQGLLLLAEDGLPEGINPSKEQFDLALIMALEAFNRNNEVIDAPLNQEDINEQFRDLALLDYQQPAWTSEEWGYELAYSSQIIFSDNSDLAISTDGYWDSSLYFWDSNQPLEPIAIFEADSGNIITNIAISSDGLQVAALDTNGSIIVWDFKNSDEPQLLTAPDGTSMLTFSPDGTILITGGGDGILYYWDTSNLDFGPLPLIGHNGEISATAFSSDGNFVASSSYNNELFLWDFTNLDAIDGRLVDTGTLVTAITFSPSGELLASGGLDGNITLWDISDPYSPFPFTTFFGDPGNLALSLQFSPDESQIAVGQSNGSIYVWSGKDTTVPRILDGNNLINPGAFGFSADGSSLRSVAADDNFLYSWDLTVPEYQSYKVRGNNIFGLYSMAFMEGQSRLVTYGNDGDIAFWDLEQSPNAINLFPMGFSEISAFSADGRYFAMGRNDQDGSNIDIIDLINGEIVTIDAPENMFVNSIAISPDGSLLVAGDDLNGFIEVWNLASGNLSSERFDINLEEGAYSAVGPILFSDDGRYLASGTTESAVHLWEVNDLSEIQEVDYYFDVSDEENTPAWPTAIAFSADNSLLAISTDTGYIDIWNLTNNDQPQTFFDEDVNVTALAFSPDGSSLVTGDENGTLRVWLLTEQESGESFYNLDGHNHTVNDIQYSPDGSTITSIGEDGFILVQPTLETLIDIACQRSDRNSLVLAWEESLSDSTYEEICFP